MNPHLRLAAIALLVTLTGLGCSNQKKEPDPDTPARQLYLEAKGALEDGEYETAVEQYELLESRYPFGPYAEQAQLEIAYAYYKYDEPESAIAAAERFMRLHPRHEHVDYALFLEGLANVNRGRSFITRFFPRDPSRHDQTYLRDAYNAFRELARRFPDSRYTPAAQDQMLVLRNQMAEHGLRVAEYYMRREAWLAAANRARSVIVEYQGAPQMPAALEIMIEAYERLDRPELARDARQVLELNFPDGGRAAGNAEDPGEDPGLLDRLKGAVGLD